MKALSGRSDAAGVEAKYDRYATLFEPEAIHAGYGRRWLRAALEAEGRSGDEWRTVVAECEDLVSARIAAATTEEKDAIRQRADALIEKAEEVLGPHDGGVT